jgi:HEAT repeat protein
VDPLLALLHDESPAIRLAAIDALVYCFDSALLKELAQLRKADSSGEVRSRAELALRTLTMEKYF